jgi:hypothetical protein
MDKHRIQKRLLEIKMYGRRPRGRLRELYRGEDNTEEWLVKKQEWADIDSWRLLCTSQPTSVETTQGRSQPIKKGMPEIMSHNV